MLENDILIHTDEHVVWEMITQDGDPWNPVNNPPVVPADAPQLHWDVLAARCTEVAKAERTKTTMRQQNGETLGGADANFCFMQPPRVPANSRISDVSELAAFSCYEVFEVQRLAPWLAALPVTTKININTASDEVLTAMGGDFAEQFMEVVIEDRPFAAVADFHQAISRAFQFSLPDTSMRWPASLVDVKSDYFQLYMEVSLGEARIEVKSIMDRRDRGAPVIISREVVVVPASLPEQSPEKLSAAEELFADEAYEGRNINQSMETNRVQPACLMMGEFTQ